MCCSNGFALLIKVGQQAELGKLRFRPMSKFGKKKAQNCLPRRPLRCTPRARRNADASSIQAGRPHHSRAPLPCAPARLKWTPSHTRCFPIPRRSLSTLSGVISRSPRPCLSSSSPWPWPPLLSSRAPPRHRCSLSSFPA